MRLQVSEKDKDTRGVKGQLQEVQDEVMKLTTKLSDMRSQKIKFSRLAREKGEEIGKNVVPNDAHHALAYMYTFSTFGIPDQRVPLDQLVNIAIAQYSHCPGYIKGRSVGVCRVLFNYWGMAY